MIARGFKSVVWVAAVGGAALSCYMVSLRVATERADLARVEREIIAAKRDIRSLQTELGTRGRLSQLEQWNAEVLALSAPSSAQFVDNAFTLARLEQHGPTVQDRVAQVQLASATTVAPAPQPEAKAAAPVLRAVAPPPAPVQPALVHRASFTAAPVAAPQPAAAKPQPSAAKPQPSAAKPQPSAAKPQPAAAKPQPTAAPAAAKAPVAVAKAEPKPKKDARPARLDPRLASDIGVAAKAEKSNATGGN
ncbi:MAG TPA: hypothetical protein VF727_14840 [Allosphingosinicella sp.]